MKMRHPKGLPFTKEHKRKIKLGVRLWANSHPIKQARGLKSSPANKKGYKQASWAIKKRAHGLLGRRLTISHRRNISKGHGDGKGRWLGPVFGEAAENCWTHYGGRCARCNRKLRKIVEGYTKRGDKRPGNIRHTHHVDWNERNNLQRNLILLCGGCHGYYHRVLHQVLNLKNNLSSYPKSMREQFWRKVNKVVDVHSSNL